MEKEKAAEALKESMAIELQGREFYLVAAEKTEDERGKEIFSFLSREEQRHFQYIRNAYDNIMEGKAFLLEIPERPESYMEAEIFSPEFKKRIGGKNFAASALGIGILLEKNSFELYSNLARMSSSDDLRNLYFHLSRWEKTHYEMLNREWESIKEDFWAQNRFAPF